MALANSNFAEVVREGLQDDLITVGLEANCNDLLGMLSGLKYDSDSNARRVGLVFYDSHRDFNIPENNLVRHARRHASRHCRGSCLAQSAPGHRPGRTTADERDHVGWRA